MDEKEYQQIFHKDDRNHRGGPNAKKRTNVREVMRRLQQIEKRKGNAMQESEEEEPVVEEAEPRRKYDNGKPQRVLKVQEYYEEEPAEEKKKGKKGKGK